MKCAVVVVVTLVALLASASGEGEKYTTQYDSVNLDEILNSDRLFNSYYECIMDKGKCSPDGKKLKETIPDALVTGCSKCSEKQKDGVEKVIKYMIEKKKSQYEQLEKKFDPKGVYRKRYDADLKAMKHKS